MPGKYIERILAAKVYDVAVESPIDEMPSLSLATGNRIVTKREDLQSVFSFKLRGAYNKIAHLSEAVRKRGVVAASAGNHAQGVAVAAKRLQTKAIIVMPVTTPAIKVRSVKERGGSWVQVVMHGDKFDVACEHAMVLAKEQGSTFVHPYDDPEVIAGQGTVGMEIDRQFSGNLDAVFIPVGGGGLIAGVASYLKHVRPRTKIIGVESEESACLQAAMKAGRRVKLPRTGIFADGVAVAKIGRETFRVAKRVVDDVVTVTNDEICGAIKLMFDDTRSIAEPSGALSLAGLIKYARQKKWKNKTLLNIHSGANVNFDRLRYISERYAVGEQTEALLAVTISEVAGSLVKLCKDIGKHDITEFNYRHDNGEHAHVFVGLSITDGAAERRALVRTLKKKGYGVVDLSGNELAKTHVSHMVGGPAALDAKEHVYSFEFPERQGILGEVLAVMRNRWNISLFHYRKHGGIYANVLFGLQDLPGEKHDIADFLKELAYPYVDESRNPAYITFLKGGH